MRVTVQLSEGLAAGERRLIRAARLAPLLRSSGAVLGVEGSLTVRLVMDPAIADLNERFRSVAGPTDVLAFPSGENGYVGDVAISVESACRQSLRPVEELRLLAVHGLLHCLGYDHVEASEAREMTVRTRQLLPDQDVPDLVPVS